MKKTTVILFLFILTSIFCINAQEKPSLALRHEVKLNLGISIARAFPEVSYEYLLSEDMSVGAAVGFGFDTEDSDGYSFRATPFARWFFSRKERPAATGFFLEANGAIGTKYNDTDYYYDTPSSGSLPLIKESSFTAGVGMAIGWIYLSKNNWTGELLFGAGRNFIYDKDYTDDDISLYSRVGVSIGKRF